MRLKRTPGWFLLFAAACVAAPASAAGGTMDHGLDQAAAVHHHDLWSVAAFSADGRGTSMVSTTTAGVIAARVLPSPAPQVETGARVAPCVERASGVIVLPGAVSLPTGGVPRYVAAAGQATGELNCGGIATYGTNPHAGVFTGTSRDVAYADASGPRTASDAPAFMNLSQAVARSLDAAPEPGLYAMILAGFVAIAVVVRRRATLQNDL